METHNADYIARNKDLLLNVIKKATDIYFDEDCITVGNSEIAITVDYESYTGQYVLSHLHYIDIAALTPGSDKAVVIWARRAVLAKDF